MLPFFFSSNHRTIFEGSFECSSHAQFMVCLELLEWQRGALLIQAFPSHLQTGWMIVGHTCHSLSLLPSIKPNHAISKSRQYYIGHANLSLADRVVPCIGATMLGMLVHAKPESIRFLIFNDEYTCASMFYNAPFSLCCRYVKHLGAAYIF